MQKRHKRQGISSKQSFMFVFPALQVTSWNIRSFFRVSVSVSISGNIRKAFFWENTQFFRLSVSWNARNFSQDEFLLFFELGVKSAGFRLRKYKKNFLLRKYNNCFNIRARKFHFPKYKELFYFRRYSKSFC